MTTSSYTRPTLSELRAQARAYFKAQGFDTALKRAVISVIADVLAFIVYGIYGFLDYIIQQIFPDTATGEYLSRWCAIYSIARVAATYAAGSVIFTGTAGTPIPAGSGVDYVTTGISYITDAAGTIDTDGSVTVAATATTAGADGNIDAGASLALSSAISGVDATATVGSTGMTGGSDEETETSWRNRLITRIQTPPQGGTADDYEAWAKKSSSEVTRAWAYPRARGAGTVDVYFVMDGRDDIIPTATDEAVVQAYIDDVRPITDDCQVIAPVGTALNAVLSSLTPNTATVQAAVLESWTEMIKTYAEPGGTISFQNQMCAAIKNATGVTGFTISDPPDNETAAAGHIFTPGTVTFPS